MNAQAPRNEALTNAFRFSGIIHAGLNDLERHSRDLAMQSLETQLAAAWRAEVRQYDRHVDPEVSARLAAQRRAAYERAAEKRLAQRKHRENIILDALRKAPSTRTDMMGLIDLSGGAFTYFLREMCEAGLITASAAPGSHRRFVYTVAQ